MNAAIALSLMAGVALPFSAFADKGDLVPVEKTTAKFDDPNAGHSLSVKNHDPVYISYGKAELIDVPADIGDVMVANSSIIDVKAVQSNRLYVVGLKVGDTNLIVLDPGGNEIARYDVHVKYDLDAIQALVNQLFPGEDIRIGSIHDQIMVSGEVSTPEVASKASGIIGKYVGGLGGGSGGSVDSQIANLLSVRGEQQVMLQVKVVEASRSAVKELGLETHANDPNELSATTLFGADPPGSIADRGAAASFATGAGIALTEDATGIAKFFHDTGIEGIGELSIVLNALENENLISVLAEPNLTAVSGEQAGFLAGGEFPVPVGRDQNGNIVVEFREFGVSLNFRPTVMSDDRIALQMNTEVSSLDFENAVKLSDLVVPGLDVRKASTSVEMPSGGTLMIAGILQSKTLKGMAGLPGIKDTPVLGKLVSSDSFKREETELLVFITPYLVQPYAQKDNAEKEIKHAAVNIPLQTAYAQNIKRAYEVKDDKKLFEGSEPYGYILE